MINIFATPYIAEYCGNTRYIIKVDDDIYVNIFLLLSLITTQHSTRSRFFLGFVIIDGRILRYGQGDCMKHCLNDDLFPGIGYSGGSRTFRGIALADLGGVPGARPPTGPNSFIFAYNFNKKHPCQRSTSPQRIHVPLWEILDPPLDSTR